MIKKLYTSRSGEFMDVINKLNEVIDYLNDLDNRLPYRNFKINPVIQPEEVADFDREQKAREDNQ